jgi:hypothetical protein
MILALFALKSEIKNYAFVSPFRRFCSIFMSLFTFFSCEAMRAENKFINAAFVVLPALSESDKSPSFSTTL